MKYGLYIIFISLGFRVVCLGQAEVTIFPQWETEATSFVIHVDDGTTKTISLYGVESPVIVIGGDELKALKLWRQKMQFGVVSIEEIWRVGLESRQFVLEHLEQPFVVKTTAKHHHAKSSVSFGDAKQDLASELVSAGLAWAIKEDEPHPDGRSSNVFFKELKQHEEKAKKARLGIWKFASPSSLRPAQTDRAILETHEKDIAWAMQRPSALLNPNKASFLELQLLNGVGPEIARRIINYRILNPAFTKPVDLKNIDGINDVVEAKIRDNLYFPVEPISFYFALNADSKESVEFEKIKATSKIKIRIIGYASRDGSSDSNLKLSERRAWFIKRKLIEKGANEAHFIDVRGVGESQPAETPKKSRRVDVFIEAPPN